MLDISEFMYHFFLLLYAAFLLFEGISFVRREYQGIILCKYCPG